MKTETLDLRELFGNKYKIGYDPAAGPRSLLRKDPEYLLIPAKYGEFYPFDNRIAFDCTSSRVAKRILKKLGGQVLPYRGISDDGEIGEECTFIFDAETFKAVAKIAKAETKRKISEKKRQELAEQSRKNANYRPQEEGSGF
jgi:sulfite reductase alpha subunit-like flavoprotein